MTLLRLALAVALAGALSGPARAAEEPVKHHALSLIGEPKYPAGFTHFSYVNPDAPKGGSVRLADIGSFDSLNPILYRGEAAGGLSLVFESLMADSIDEFDRLRPDSRMGELPVRLFLGNLQAPRRGALA